MLGSTAQDVLQLLFLVGQAERGREDQQEADGKKSQRPIHFCESTRLRQHVLTDENVLKVDAGHERKSQEAENGKLFTEETASDEVSKLGHSFQTEKVLL